MGESLLHPAEGDLAALANRDAQDALFSTLVEAGRSGMGAAVGLLVDGMYVYGTLADPALAAGEVDDFFRWILDVAERADDEDRPEFWQAARERNTTMVASVERHRAWEEDAEKQIGEHEGDDGFDTREAPGDVARDFIELESQPVVTLRNAIVTTGGSPAVQIRVLRLRTAHIAGWWLLPDRTEDGGVTIKHPPDAPAGFGLTPADEES